MPGRWVGLKTLILRECVVSVRFWSVTLAPPVITTILYFTIFGEIIGERIGSLDGVDYIQNPMFYMVNAFRYGFLGVSDVPVGTAFSVICAFAAVLFLAAVRLMARGSGIRD